MPTETNMLTACVREVQHMFCTHFLDQEFRRFACEGGSRLVTADLTCPGGSIMEVQSVFYGARASGNPCGAPVEETCQSVRVYACH